MGQINTNNYPTVDSLADADLLIVENATHGTGTTTPKQLRENAIGTDTLQTTSQTVTGAINELKGATDDNYALAGSGMMTEYSAGVIDTNIYLNREPKIGDRLLILFTQTFTQSTPIKIYKENGGTAYTLNFDMWGTDYALKGLCLLKVVDFLGNLALRWLYSYSGTDYQAGQHIGINGDYINNTAPQLGDNSEYHEKTSEITDGNLGTYGYYAKYIIINFKARAVPNGTTGKYSLQLSRGAVLEDASLVDRDGNDFTAPIKAGAVLLCSVDYRNDIVTVLNNDIMANGDIIDGQGNTLSVLAEALTKTASGNPVVIDDCAGGKARSLKTTIEAIQDLHGYDKPWAGGAYKNKLPMTVSAIKAANTTGTWTGNVYTINDGTITILTDDADNVLGFKANGTFSAQTGLIIISGASIAANDYILNGAPSGSGYASTWLNIKVGNTNYNDIGSGVSATISAGDTVNVICYIASGANIDNKTFKPMLRLSTETDPTFAPWENKCPISGRTEARVDTENEDSTESAYAVIQLGTTVYGADINWDTGVATLTHVATSITGDNVSNISPQSAVDTEGGKRININITNAKYCGSATGLSDIISDRLSVASANDIYSETTPNRISVNDVGGIVLRYAGAATVEAAVAALNANPVQACYKLATPTTLQLTPTQLQMLKGYNRVSIDNGTIELGYIAKIA